MTSTGQMLLFALLAACARCGVTQGDPLPAALVELVRNNPISSIEDLQLLLLTDSIEEDGTSLPNGGHRLPRSLDAQPAQQALCKVRTEVVEVTRAMLDRSNANFMLWPPCVEVQRCSGCCNTKSLQCVPVLTHTRYLQVMKIEYVNKKPTYAKAVVSVVDHVECRCQPAPRPPIPKKKSSRRQHNHNKDHQRNQTLNEAHGQVVFDSKDELHQWDELKQNQKTSLEELLEQHWSPRGDTFTPPGEGYSLVGEDTSQFGEGILFGPHWVHNSTRVSETKAQTENQEATERNHGRSSDGNKTFSSLDVVKEKNKGVEDGEWALLNMTKGKVELGKQEILGFQERNGGMATGMPNSHTNDVPPSTNENIQTMFSLTTERNRFQPTKEPNPEPREQETHKNTETPDEEQIINTEEERREHLHLYKKLHHEKEILRQQEIKLDEEKIQKQKDKEDSQHHLHNKHHHLQTTTHKSETTSQTTTQKAPVIAGPRPPVRPNPVKKRKRKNRKQISKAAMRAMLM
ncbi:uncharacterized protein pdgfbb isoform X2 [Thalassophryne amazonica]|uniref:uncharacterized protein pdgfbb isoform X2 n=1 Tax=Thalassophryne amazonica TaxID=390379 RepID=UPI001470FBA1|nr:uncharacterized protein pdgfbb isoform X2 [Thalassophryne amazonica]